MIYIITAMYAESHAFINHFQLKKENSHTRFQVFLNREAKLCLIVSGAGSVSAAVAVSSLCTEYGAGWGDFLLNVGICAQMRHDEIPQARDIDRTGQIFLCNKILEQSTGKTFYPDILYRHGFAEAQIVTGPKLYEKTRPAAAYSSVGKDSLSARPHESLPSDQASHTPLCLYDMEAAAVYQAGSYYFGPHQMSFLKIISDNGILPGEKNNGDITPEQVKHLVGNHIDRIADYLTTLQTIFREEQYTSPFGNDALPKQLEKLCLDLHCSRSMSESVRQHLRYCSLAGVDYASVLEEMYRSGELPCKDKREGKQCFERLKERLL